MPDRTRIAKQSFKSVKRRPWYVIALWFLISFCLLTTGVVLYIWKVNPSIVTSVIWGQGGGRLDGLTEFNILVAGLDEYGGAKRTDTIMIMNISLTEKYANVVSIPRDTRVNIPGVSRMDKINSAYQRGGAELLVRTLENFLDVQIDFYCVFQIKAAAAMIDAMGGVDIDVEKSLRYTDRAQNLYINVPKGRQHLDGKTATEYARFRHDAHGDLGRIERQQKLIDALSKKAASYEIIKHLPRLAMELMKNDLIVTNLSFNDGVILSRIYDDQMRRNTMFFTMPGTPETIGGISYVTPHENELPYLAGGLLKGGFHPRNRLVRISVENGCGSPMIAQIYRTRLEYYGFNIIKTDNARNFDHDKTLVVVKHKTPFTNSVARLLGAEVVNDYDQDSLADLEVILGRDKLDR